jgi:hypothetical protein
VPSRKKAAASKSESEEKAIAIKAPDPKRVEQVVRWIAAGATESDILEAIAEQWPEEDKRPLIVAALQEITAASQTPPDLAIGWCLQSTRELYRRMVEVGDFTGALRAIKLLADLQQLL